MNRPSTFRRLLEAILVAAIGGGIAYALTARLAPASVSALLVALIVATVSALAVLAPTALIGAFGRRQKNALSAPDTYFDTNFSVHKDEGWND